MTTWRTADIDKTIERRDETMPELPDKLKDYRHRKKQDDEFKRGFEHIGI